MDEGTKALLSHTVRDAIYDIRPHPDRPRLKPYLYWNPEKKKACVKMLLKRSVALQALAKDGSNEKAFCSKYAAHVTGVSNNERSMQKRQLKQLFLMATRAGTAQYCQYRSSTGSFCFDF
jgi:hypothetical protein